MVRRVFWMLLFAGLLAMGLIHVNGGPLLRSAASAAVAEVHAQDGEQEPCLVEGESCLAYQWPDICRMLDPWTYWWGFFGCEGVELEANAVLFDGLERTTITLTPLGRDHALIETEVVRRDGTVQRIERIVPRRYPSTRN